VLINCVVYEGGRRLADIPVADISDHIAHPDSFVWVGLANPTPEELSTMAEEFGLHPLAVEDASKGHQRPKIEEYGDSMFAVLKTIEKAPPEGDEQYIVGEIAIFVGRNYVLSVRHRALRGFAEVRARAELEPDLLKHGAGIVFYLLMDAVVDRYFPIIEDLEAELEDLESGMFRAPPSRSTLESFYALKQKLMTLKHAVDPLSEAVGKLVGGRVPPLCAGMQEYFRDVYDHLNRIDGAIEGIFEMLHTATQVNLSLIDLAYNEDMKKLAAWAAMIATPTLIAGIYGMNFHAMPELDWRFGYPFALGLMAAIDLTLYGMFKRSGWL
jgi:magnesium transporter